MTPLLNVKFVHLTDMLYNVDASVTSRKYHAKIAKLTPTQIIDEQSRISSAFIPHYIFATFFIGSITAIKFSITNKFFRDTEMLGTPVTKPAFVETTMK